MAEREAFAAEQPSLETNRLVFLDETGSNITMTRPRARSRRGRPVYGSIPLGRGQNLTVVGAVRASGGLVAWRAIDGAMTGARFLAFVVEVLIPALSPGDVLVMDNLSAHKTKAVRDALAAAPASRRSTCLATARSSTLLSCAGPSSRPASVA